MAIDPDVQVLLDALTSRVDDLENAPPVDLTQIQADISALQAADMTQQNAITLLDSRISALENSAPTPTVPFRMFDELLYSNKPDLGLEPLGMLYRGAYSFPNGQSQLPDLAQVEQLGVDRIGQVVSHDLELWWNEPQQVDWYVQISQAFNMGFGDGEVGHYGLFPERNYWTPQKPPEDPLWDQWRAKNDKWVPLLPHVTCLFPSLYTFYDDQDGWEVYARANVAESRRLAPNYPCYPVIWPQYHSSNATLSGQLIAGDYWRRQLNVLHEIADGIVLWGGWQVEWDDQAPWWVETQAFISGL